MKTPTKVPQTIDDYLAGFPPEVQRLLEKMRKTIHAAVPEATETIKYGLPTFVLHGNLIHFGGFKSHLGLYATPTGHAKFKTELSQYVSGKGSVQFPLDQPIPFALVARIARFRASENKARAKKA